VWAFAAIAYVAIVLGVDLLATFRVSFMLDWSFFRWNGASVARSIGIDLAQGTTSAQLISRFDLFKFVFWFVVPFGIALFRMDWGALGVARWKKLDYAFLAIMGVVGLGALLIIPYVPGLRQYYPDMSHLATHQKWMVVCGGLVWVCAWLPGWEFMHRYTLLRAMDGAFPRYGWLVVPLSEGLYHLPKHPLEALGMVAFAVVLTAWARRRGNVLLPFLAHLVIEVGLLVFLVF